MGRPEGAGPGAEADARPQARRGATTNTEAITGGRGSVSSGPLEEQSSSAETDAFDAISAAENALRELIQQTLSGKFGGDWLSKSGISSDRVAEFERKRSEEVKRREGTVPDERILAYSELHDLQTVIRKHWELFKPCLGDRKTTDVYLDRLGDFRISTMHTRPLLPFERNLVVGMAGELRNKVTIYRSMGSGTDERELFPRIERLTDSFGRTTTGWETARRTAAAMPLIRIHPGDIVTVECVGWDPEAVELTWTVWIDLAPIMSMSGTRAEYRWEVREKDIAQQTPLKFFLHA
jgi:hypothetical protein